MNPKTARQFVSRFPELCVKCWYCGGSGVCQSIGGKRIVDCWECFRLGKKPDIIKMVKKLLEENQVTDNE